MCPGCLLAASSWGVMWCAGKLISWRAHRRQALAIAAIMSEPSTPSASCPLPPSFAVSGLADPGQEDRDQREDREQRSEGQEAAHLPAFG